MNTNDEQAAYEAKGKSELDLSRAEDIEKIHGSKPCPGMFPGGEAVYTKREPTLSDEAAALFVRGVEGEKSGTALGIRAATTFYENLIASGDLIRRDELATWLEERLKDEEKGERWDMHAHGGVSAIQSVIDHINKKGQ